ncbi:MAG: hypothetical protein ACLFST_07580 [Spirochaetia bacterium]
MAVQINYEDNIFYLTTQIRNLKNGIKLDIDPDFFKDKFVEDILFIDSGLRKIYQSLTRNVYLIHRNDYLRSLQRAKKAFVVFMEEIESDASPFCAKLSPFRKQLSASKDTQQNEIKEIHQQLNSGNDASVVSNGEDVVSQEEYQFLFKAGEEGEV